MKKGFSALLFSALFVVSLPFQTMAASKSEVELTQNGEKAGVTVTLPKNTGKSVTALELHIDVTNNANADMQFVFSNDLNATIAEKRYSPDTGEMIVYIAGAKNLFTNDKAYLGSVVAESDVEGIVELKVEEDSLKVADGIYGIVSANVEPQSATLKTQGKDDSSSQPESSSGESSSSSSSSSTSSSSTSSSSSSVSSSSSSASSSSSSSSNNTNNGNNNVVAPPPANSSNDGNGQGTTSNNKKPSSSKPAQSEESEESSSSESKSEPVSESSSESKSESQQQSSSSQSVAQQEKEKADTFVWVVAGVLGVVAVGAVATIVIRTKMNKKD